jgi:MFS family permease
VQEGGGLEPMNTQRPRVRKLLVNPSFIGITFIMTVAILVFHALSVHLTPHATDVGVSKASAAAALGLIGGFSIPGRITSGIISERIGWQRTLAMGLFGMALSVIWLLALHDTWMIYCFAFTYGVCHGIRIPAQLGILGQFFGTASLGQLIGVSTAIGQLAGALAPSLAGLVYDTTGSYSAVFLIVIAALAAAALAAARMKGERLPSH